MQKLVGLGILGFILSASIPAHADSLESAAKELAKAASQLKGGRVAVLLFPYENGDVSSGSSLVSERLTTLLAQRKHINIIERSRLASVLSEIRLEGSGVTQSTGSAKPGEILGVDAVVTGTLDDLMDGETEVNARIIRVATGEIIAAAAARIDRTWDDRPQPPEAPDSDDDDDTHYVMHASPLIFTPQASRGGMPPPTEYQAAYAGGGGSDSVPRAPQYVQGAPGVNTGFVQSESAPYDRKPHEPPHPHSDGQAQWLYAMGLTLDTQGHHQQATQFYKQLLQDTPAPAPLRDRAEHQINGSHSSAASSN